MTRQSLVADETSNTVCGKNAVALAASDGTTYNCTCHEGHRRVDSSDWSQGCEPVDECAEKTHNCHNLAQCNDTRYGYTCCCCQYPYTGDGYNCTSELLVSEFASSINCNNICSAASV